MATIANLTIDQGANFSATINLNNLDATDFSLTGYTVKSQMARSYASATKTDITATILNSFILIKVILTSIAIVYSVSQITSCRRILPICIDIV